VDLVSLLAALLGLLFVLAVAARAHYSFWTRRYTLELGYAERHDLVTDDGVPVTLHRLAPPSLPSSAPVLLVHGVAANHRNVDAEPDRSLARHLHGEGRDVWLLTLRSGQSSLSRAQKKKVRFTAMVANDVPVAIRFVLERTRATRLDYVGFSMGGMLLYASLGRTVPREHIGRVGIIGSPGEIVLPFSFLRAFRRMPRWLFPSLWLRMLARMAAFFVEAFHTPLHRYVYNPDNVERGTTARAMVNLIEDVPAELSADFARWALEGGVFTVDGAPALDGLADVRSPAIFFAGAADRIAPPHTVRAAHDAWGRDVADLEKRFVVLGRASGHEHDYGHGDLAVGRALQKDLFEPLAAFLAET
jgi:pimeloyl-ACP methyl ester carboxylesterase